MQTTKENIQRLEFILSEGKQELSRIETKLGYFIAFNSLLMATLVGVFAAIFSNHEGDLLKSWYFWVLISFFLLCLFSVISCLKGFYPKMINLNDDNIDSVFLYKDILENSGSFKNHTNDIDENKLKEFLCIENEKYEMQLIHTIAINAKLVDYKIKWFKNSVKALLLPIFILKKAICL